MVEVLEGGWLLINHDILSVDIHTHLFYLVID